jgi:lysophospholipase L1-like esterase
MDWVTRIWAAQEKLNENIGRNVYPYIVPEAYCGWVPAPERTNAFLNGNRYYADRLTLRSLPGRDLPAKKNSNCPRVLLVGDSNIHGDETDFEECWVTQLGKILGEDYEIINGGVPGYGIDQAFWRSKALVEKLMPDIVVLGFAACDLTRQVNMLRLLRSTETDVPFLKPIYVSENGKIRKIEIPEATITNFAEIFSDVGAQNLLSRYDYYFPDSKASLFNSHLRRSIQLAAKFVVPENCPAEILKKVISFWAPSQSIEITLRIMERFGSWCLSNQVAPVIMLLPLQPNFARFNSYNFIYSYFQKAMPRLGIPFVDPKPKLVDKKFIDSRFWHKGGHLNAEGSRAFSMVVAEALPNVLETKGIV